MCFLYGVRISAEVSFVLSQFTRLTDGRKFRGLLVSCIVCSAVQKINRMRADINKKCDIKTFNLNKKADLNPKYRFPSFHFLYRDFFPTPYTHDYCSSQHVVRHCEGAGVLMTTVHANGRTQQEFAHTYTPD